MCEPVNSYNHKNEIIVNIVLITALMLHTGTRTPPTLLFLSKCEARLVAQRHYLPPEFSTVLYNSALVLNKRPIGHIAHLRKQFKSLNKYDYIITLIQRIRKNFMRIYWFFI